MSISTYAEAKKALMSLSRIKEINRANPNCPTQCRDAQQAVLSIANQEKNIDPTKYLIICTECSQSIWKILQKK